MNCTTLPHKESSLNARESLLSKKAIDEDGRIISEERFHDTVDEITTQARKSYQVDRGPLFARVEVTPSFGGKYFKAEPNELAFNDIDEARKKLAIYDSQESIGSFRQPSSRDKEVVSIEDKVNHFLSSIGVSVEKVDQLTDAAGNKLDAVAKASMLNKIIQVVDGKADMTTLPEEAAHFFVSLLGEENALYKAMFKDIPTYRLYSGVVQQYKGNKLYRRSDGTLNFDMIKKEAIGKLIAEHILVQGVGDEYTESIAKAQKWWEKVWDYITKIFAQSKVNPFQESAKRILANQVQGLKNIHELDSTDEFLQVDNVYSRIKADQQRIHLDNSVDPRTGEKRHQYTVDGKNVRGSVTELLVDKWYKARFPTDNRTERQKNIDSLKAQEGDKVHADAQNIIERYIDANTGELLTVPRPVSTISTNQSIYTKLESYIGELLRSYPAATKFMAEVRIHDAKRNMPGSIDLLVLTPDGAADIYDWKSQEVAKDQTDLKWFKEPAYRIQLEAYRKILTQEYGITRFNKVRAIPIKTNFIYKKEQGTYTPKTLADIEVGSIYPGQIPEDKAYLLPVVAQDEKTGDDKLDKLITQLNTVLEKISQQHFDRDKRYLKAEELNKIRKAIRDLQVRQDIGTFVENGLAEVMKYQDKLDNDTVTKSDVLDSIDILSVYAQAQLLLREQLKNLRKKIGAETDPVAKGELETLQSDFLKMSANSKDVLFNMEEKLKEIGVQIAEKEGISNLLTAEKSMDRMKTLFRSISTLPTRSIQTFYKLLSTSQSKRDFQIDDLNEKLHHIKENVEKWSASKGISRENMFDDILKINADGNWTGDFLDKFSKDYFVTKNEAIKTGDIKWISDNTTFDRERYEKDLASYKAVIETVAYSPDPVKNKERQDKALAAWINARDVDTSDFAKLNKKNYYLKPKEQWYSNKWSNLLKEENKPLKEAFDYFQLLKSFSDKLGMIDFENGFIPSIRQDKLELAVFAGLSNLFNKKGLFETLKVDADKAFGEIDPITGELVKKIPVNFLHDLGVKKADGTIDYSLKSKDLFKVFSIWGNHMYNYEAMQSIKDSAEILVAVERSKKSLVTNVFGNVTEERKEKEGNQTNAEVLENFVKYYVYGQKIGDNADYAIKIGGKEYSATKTGRAVLSFLSLKTLALNVLSGTSTFVGGSGNAFFQASKREHFTEGDWARGLRDFTSRDPKAMAALDYFDVNLEDEKQHHSNQLSINDAVKHVTLDKLFFIQKNGDKAVQYPVALTMMRTHMVEGGKIVDINAFVKNKYDYENSFYSLPTSERKALQSKIDTEVKELKATRSLQATAEVKDKKLIIPGIDRKSQEVYDFRNKIKKVNKNIIGNASHDDINQIRIGILGQVLMQFRSWMPQMVTDRFGDMSYDMDLESYQYGKGRLFLKHLFSSKIFPLIGEMVTGFGANTITRAKQRYVEFKGRMAAQGEEFHMTEAQFIDMYLGNLRSQLREMAVLSSFLAVAFWAKPGSSDRDKSGMRKFIARAMDKYQNEFSFYYSPSEFTQMLKNPIPLVGLLTDFEKFGTQTIGQIYGFALQDDVIMEKNHPFKYLGKIMPITKEAISTYGLFDDDFRKSWGLQNR
ncbi:MAG TPA: PD-(D/E)XK nuclease family protein [Puia sp.]|jgi:hypothetical protein